MKKEGSMKAESFASIVTHQSKCGDGQEREERCLVLKCIYFPSLFKQKRNILFLLFQRRKNKMRRFEM